MPSVFYKKLEPIFIRLAKDELLKRCLKGMTQNQNEALNGNFWNRCPKIKFCGLTRVNLAVSETICEFNRGAHAKVILQIESGVDVNMNIIKSATK